VPVPYFPPNGVADMVNGMPAVQLHITIVAQLLTPMGTGGCAKVWLRIKGARKGGSRMECTAIVVGLGVLIHIFSLEARLCWNGDTKTSQANGWKKGGTRLGWTASSSRTLRQAHTPGLTGVYWALWNISFAGAKVQHDVKMSDLPNRRFYLCCRR
jgi:hypothetical protein